MFGSSDGMASFEAKETFDENSVKNTPTEYEFNISTCAYFLCFLILAGYFINWLIQKSKTSTQLDTKKDDNVFDHQFESLLESRQLLQTQYNSMSAVYKDKMQSQNQNQTPKTETKKANVFKQRFAYGDDSVNPLSRSSGSSYKPRFGNTSGG